MSQQPQPLQSRQPPPQNVKYPMFQPKEAKMMYATFKEDDVFVKEEKGKYSVDGLRVGIARKQDEWETKKRMKGKGRKYCRRQEKRTDVKIRKLCCHEDFNP
jgi:hypothetical protein